MFCVPGTCGGPKMVLYPLKLKVQMIESQNMGTENQTQFFAIATNAFKC